MEGFKRMIRPHHRVGLINRWVAVAPNCSCAPGTVATRCKPSSGAGGVCLETTLERLGLPSHEEWQPPQGDPTMQK